MTGDAGSGVTGPTCQRCGVELSMTEVVASSHGRYEIRLDGSGLATVLAGTSACSWNCLAVLAAQLAGPDADAAVQIVAERERQVTVEGWTPEHDQQHPEGELARAGMCYAGPHAGLDHSYWEVRDSLVGGGDGDETEPPSSWPWYTNSWKPKDRMRDLVRAGALVAAEADRELRAKRQREKRRNRK